MTAATQSFGETQLEAAMPHSRIPQVIAIIAGVVPGTTGCVGFLVGYGIDRTAPHVTVPRHPDSIGFESGDKIDVVLKSGERITGRFHRVEPFPTDKYETLYRAAHARLATQSIWMPLPGDTVHIELETGETVEGEFRGVGADGPLVRSAHDTTLQVIGMDDVRAVRENGTGVVTGARLDALVYINALPVRSSLVLQPSTERSRRFALNSIERIEQTRNTCRWVGAAVEAAAWVAAVAIAAHLEDLGSIP